MKILRKQILYIVITMLISCVVFILLYFNPNSSLFFSVETTIICFYFLCILFAYKDRFSPYLFIILSNGLGILDIILVALKIRNVSTYYDISIYEKSLFIIIIFYFFFTLAFSMKTKKEKKYKLKMVKIINNILNSSDERIILVIFSVLYTYVIYIIIHTVVNLGSINNAMNNSAVFRTNDQAYLAVLISICAIIPICFLEMKKNKTALISTIFMMIILFFTGRRGLIINSLILPGITYYHYRNKEINNNKLFIIGGICIVLILGLGILRNQTSNIQNENWFIKIVTDLTVSTKMGENLPDTIYVLENGQVSYQYFKYLNRGIIGLIPRKFWKNKPELIDHSMIVSKLVYDNTTYGRPIGAFGFAYFCFGYLGVVVIAFITGIITKGFYNWMINTKSYISIFVYSILIIYVLNIIKPEALMNIIAVIMIVIISTVISKILSKKGNKN